MKRILSAIFQNVQLGSKKLNYYCFSRFPRVMIPHNRQEEHFLVKYVSPLDGKLENGPTAPRPATMETLGRGRGR